MANNTKRFVYNTLVERDNICNLSDEASRLAAALESFDKIVIYGRRDCGKTSLIKNVVIPDWKKNHPNGLALYAEFYGVRSLDEISEKLTIYFNKAYRDTFKIQAHIKSAAALLKGIRPTISFAQDGSLEVDFKTDAGSSIIALHVILENLQALNERGTPVALFLDEFQDIALVSKAEASLREELQKLPFEIPVVILGSKQHLLAKIFQKPRAPFFNWGKRMEIGALPVEEYNDYIVERLHIHGVTTDRATITKLQETLLYNAEAINMFCSEITYQLGQHVGDKSKLTQDNVFTLLHQYIESMIGEFEVYLNTYTQKERYVLAYIAKAGWLKTPTGKDALTAVNISANGMRKIMLKFMDNADIYHEERGYILSKPLLMFYLKNWKM